MAGLLVTMAPLTAVAQMTVSGRVMAGDRPVQGASVGISELGIETRSIADGSYNFLIRAAQVRGQMVTIAARHRQFGSASVQMQVTGGSIVQNFTLGREERRPPPVNPPRDTSRRAGVDTTRRADTTRRLDTARAVVTPPVSRPPRVSPPVTAAVALPAARAMVDSAALAEASGPADLAVALAGRIPGLLVTAAATPGGSSLMVYRGARSLSASLQPLVVVDGVPIDNTGFRTATQQFGLGGFDYGTPLQDLTLDDVSSVTLMEPSQATLYYGSRAANGVLLVNTKQGAVTPGLSFSHRLRYTSESTTRLPAFQNSYGQGSAGQFEFFDGSGGGINDAVEESWGPKLLGQPIIQASLTEPRRPDVRSWAPHPAGLEDYFGGGRTIDASVALQGARSGASSSNFRSSLGLRSTHGLTPGSSARWLSGALTGAVRPTSRLSARGALHLVGARAENRAGTGFAEINPVSGFTRTGRQVDVTALSAHIRDTAQQINWIYTARNNPWFQARQNSNDDHRGHIIGSGALSYALSDLLSATLRFGTDNYHESRNFQVARGWKGGYPTALGLGDFSGGGFQQLKNSSAERLLDLAVSTAGRSALGSTVSGTIGVQARRNTFETTLALSDSTAGVGRATASVIDTASTSVTSAYVAGSLNRGEYLALHAGLRMERPSIGDSSLDAAMYPAVSFAYDASKAVDGLRGLGLARLRAAWWRAGNEVTPRILSQVYAGGGTAASPAFLPTWTVGSNGAERTSGTELGFDLASPGERLALEVTGYSERTSSVLIPGSGGITQLGEVSNSGAEVRVRGVPYTDGERLRWSVDVSFAKNSNALERLDGTASAIALGPSIWGASLEAQVGQPLGMIVGSRLLPDANGALVLRNGLPIPDGSGQVSFGSWQADWSSGIGSRLRYGSLELGLLLDVRMGGKVFSATNRWGSLAGTLTSTLAGRDTGLVVLGIDSVSGAPNTTNVTAEAYFHALGAVNEPWVYDASYMKLRQASLSYEVPLRFLPGYREQIARISIVGRNLFTWAKAPNIDPETALSVGGFQGFEMGQLPTSRSLGLQLSVTP